VIPADTWGDGFVEVDFLKRCRPHPTKKFSGQVFPGGELVIWDLAIKTAIFQWAQNIF
jgi:hypothetical protein